MPFVGSLSLAQATELPQLDLESHPLAGRAFDLRRGVESSPRDVLDRAAGARIVLLGETHDNPVHHELQARVLAGMAARGRQPRVAWEMIDASQADALAACLAECRDWPRELPAAIDWAETGWPDWSLYRPIANVAAQHELDMVAANLSSQELRLLAGPPSEAATQLSDALGIAKSLSAPVREGLTEALTESHCGLPIPPERLEAMIRVQRGRDRRMRDALLAPPPPDGGVLIAGRGHARLDWGVGMDLATELGPNELLSIGFVEVDAECRTFDACLESAAMPRGTAPWDIVWFTPRAEREDPCEQLLRRGRV